MSKLRNVCLAILVLCALAACDSSNEGADQEPTEVAVVATETPEPPTATTTPTRTTTPTQTPSATPTATATLTPSATPQPSVTPEPTFDYAGLLESIVLTQEDVPFGLVYMPLRAVGYAEEDIADLEATFDGITTLRDRNFNMYQAFSVVLNSASARQQFEFYKITQLTFAEKLANDVASLLDGEVLGNAYALEALDQLPEGAVGIGIDMKYGEELFTLEHIIFEQGDIGVMIIAVPFGLGEQLITGLKLHRRRRLSYMPMILIRMKV